MRQWRRVFFPVVLVVALGMLGGRPSMPHAAAPDPSVLLLLPGRTGMPAAEDLGTGIRTALLADWSHRVDIEAEHVDIARASSPEDAERQLRALLASKYGGRRFDIIIGAGVEPFDFLIRAHAALWPGTPALVCAIDEARVRGQATPPRDLAVVTTRFDMAGTLRAALALLPDTRLVALVGGAGLQDQTIHDLAREAVAEHSSLELIDLTSLPLRTMLTWVSTLPPHAIVLVSKYHVDGAGRRVHGLDILRSLTAGSQAPVFTPFAQALGFGVVGGSMMDLRAVGAEAGRLATQVLRTQKLPGTPVTSAVPSRLRFDGRQLAHWALDQRRLPPGSDVHEPLTLWEMYRAYVMIAGAVIAVGAILTVAVLVQRRRRQNARSRLADRLRFEALDADIGPALAAEPIASIETRIASCVGRVATVLGADRGEIRRPLPDGRNYRLAHGWHGEGVAAPTTTVDLGSASYLRACVEPGGGGLSFERPSDLPLDAVVEYAMFKDLGVRSFVALPLSSRDRALGFFAFSCVHAERRWTPEVIHGLAGIARHFADALMREDHAAALKARVSLAEGALSMLPGATAIVDRAGTIVVSNDAWDDAATALGSEAAAALSRGANYLEACRKAVGMPPEVALTVRGGVEAVLRGDREQFVVEYPAPRTDAERWLEVRVRRVPHLEQSAAVMHFDVTARRRDEAVARRHLAELAHMDRVAGMAQLASSIAHELNQPLAAILSNAQAAQRLLRLPTPDVNELRACVQDIVSDDQRASDVIRQMRRLLKKAEVAALPLALSDLVAATVALVSNDALLRGVSMSFTPAASLPVVYGDLVQIQQVVLNLLTNAIDAAAAGPPPRSVKIWTAVVSPDAVQVIVHDSGSGIAEDDLQKVFEPFFTNKAGGLGMGLAISRKIVEVHGGRLDAANDPAGGATFTMQLPVPSADSERS